MTKSHNHALKGSPTDEVKIRRMMYTYFSTAAAIISKVIEKEKTNHDRRN